MSGGAYNFSNIKKTLPDVPKAGEQRKQEVPALEINVLLWNINGKTYKGCAGARNLLVPRVVSQLNPDVLLLQEIPSQRIITMLLEELSHAHRRRYDIVCAGNPTEAVILYARDRFTSENIPINLDDIVEECYPGAVVNRVLKGEQEVYKDWVIAIRLTHIATKRSVIFVSFHNKRHGVGAGGVVKMATRFCNVMAKLADKQNVPVVAGADLNCADFDRGAAVVPRYVSTPRRILVAQVDYFILAWPANFAVEHTVSAEDVFPDDVPEHTHKFNPIFVALQRDNPHIKLATYKDSLDHDPLMCALNITDS